jgi:hypothetical protein
MHLYLAATEAAKVLQVDRATVSRWAKQGKFKGAVKKDDPPTWQIPLGSVESLMKKRKCPNDEIAKSEGRGQHREKLVRHFLCCHTCFSRIS